MKIILLVSSLLVFTGCGANPEDPLGKAAAMGDLEQLHELLSRGVSAADRDGALVWAARSGQPMAIYLLVKNGANSNATSGVNDWTVLMHAIHKDQPESVTALLNCGAQVNRTVRRGETALMMAAGYGYASIVGILLDHGADAHQALENGDNALDFALSGVMDIDRFTWGSCQAEVVRMLRSRMPDLRPKDPAKLRKCS